MKIKTKKQLNLPQLIEWAMDNDIKHRVFESNPNFDGVTYKLGFDKGGDLYFEESLTPTLLFTVEVEEEITEDTPLSMIIEIDEDSSCWVFENTTLKNIHETDCGTNTTKYYRDEDENMHIIWRDGKLVE